jgi:hypothetical protein
LWASTHRGWLCAAIGLAAGAALALFTGRNAKRALPAS